MSGWTGEQNWLKTKSFRIRSPRATNEARQSAIRLALRNAAWSMAYKTEKYQANLIIGYISNCL